MLFYKVTGIITDEKWIEENNDRRIKQEHARQIRDKTENFNDRHDAGSYYFVSDVDDNKIVCGIISYKPCDTDKTIVSFLKAIKMPTKEIKIDETTFISTLNQLANAERREYIDDDDEILDRFELSRLNYRNYCSIEYGENLIDEHKNKAYLFDTAEKNLTSDTLTPELDRIYSGRSNTKAYGHPVHYFIETDDKETRKTLYSTLFQALYDNGRLNSRRYCYMDVRKGQSLSPILYDYLYKSCDGGSIVVRYSEDSDPDDEEYANGELETIALLCETMLRYRNSVLTVFCFPRVCKKLKAAFSEYLGPISMIEIKEDLANTERSHKYLKMLCRNQHIRCDTKLFDKIEPEKTYLPAELRTVFDEWYNVKIKTSVFPQYKDIEICRRETAKDITRGNAYDNLNEMIGLSEAKSVINKALNYYRIQRIYKDKGIKQDRLAMYMVFTGNPGTAKTTVARLFARIMKENGLLSKGHLIEVGRSDLVGKYVGWTAQIVKDKFKAAMGGVLFIDEAYSLVEDRGGSFGDEAINTIVQEMENRRDDLVVIFAGYPDKMEEFLNKNPGLRSRIAFHVPFADYNSEELCDIARLIGKSKGITLTESAIAKLSAVFETVRKQPDFGNGRYVRNVIELSKMNQASRILSMDPDDVTESVLTSIEDVDIEVPVMSCETAKRTIGFAS